MFQMVSEQTVAGLLHPYSPSQLSKSTGSQTFSVPSKPANPIQDEATTKLVSENLFLPPVSSVMNEWRGWGVLKLRSSINNK